MNATEKQALRERLGSYLQGSPAPNGEQDAHCPLHEDRTRSMRVNWKKGVWKCFAGCGEGKFAELVALMDGPKDADVARYHKALIGNQRRLKEFQSKRGLTLRTIRKRELGWDDEARAYTIPIRSKNGTLYNIRRYRLNATSGKKIWSVKGMGTPRLYPEDQLENDALVVCEGELDALIAIQHGFPAVTGTGGASVWEDGWAQAFKGKKVVVMYDRDPAGERGAAKVARSLSRVAKVWVGTVPLKRPGSDVTDLFKKGWDAARFRELLRSAKPWLPRGSGAPGHLEPVQVGLAETFNARLAGQTLATMATVKGKRNPPYLLPQKVKLECTMDKGKVCALCPMMAADGHMTLEIAPDNPVLMKMIDMPDRAVNKIVCAEAGAKCDTRVTLDVKKHVNAEELFVRPSIELIDEESGEYTDRKIYAVGSHDTPTNQTISITGSMFRDQKNQRNMFSAWEISQVESSLDHFEVTPNLVKELSVFRPRGRQGPMNKLMEIANDISLNVTRIYGRTDMHMAMDLVFHSPLKFSFGGETIQRGWLELLIVGDTRTGKSEAATRITHHYQAGRVISCESASFAGIVGGLQQYGAGREWTITWGAVPLNDRRLVIMDEVSGLTPEQIGQMSSIRSSGIAELTKIQTERTMARTRLIWLSNPRSGRISDYTYGIHTLRPLIGNPEDIARFDFAMSLAATDVDPEDINVSRNGSRPRYNSELCHQRVLWAWSRKAEHIRWERRAEKYVYEVAVRLGQLYTEDPPLLQSANARVKIARLAVALAMATFSTENGEEVIVKQSHVWDASVFLDWLYRQHGFGYSEISSEIKRDEQTAAESIQYISQFIQQREGVAKFLRNCHGSFRSADIEEALGFTREATQQVISTLWKNNMIAKVAGENKIQPVLHDLLRDL